MDDSAGTSQAVELPAGVIGPPWQLVNELDATALSLDPPVAHDCSACAVFSEKDHTLIRCNSEDEAILRARIKSYETGRPAEVLQGSLLLSSGLWYWPRPVRIDTRKQLDPLVPNDRRILIKQVELTLRAAARRDETPAIEDTLDILFGNRWAEMDEEEVAAVMGAVREAVSNVGRGSSIMAASEIVGDKLLEAAFKSRGRNAGIPPEFRLQDTRALHRISETMPFFITDEYGRRVDDWAEREARDIIAEGIALGLDDTAISAQLYQALGSTITGRTQDYFSSLSAISVVRASTFGQISGYRDAGINAYEWVSMGDKNVCPICEWLNGQIFQVDDAIAQFDRVAAIDDPERAVMENLGFYRIRGGEIYVAPATRGGKPRATIARASPGGAFTMIRRPGEGGVGTVTPPAHGRCRCVTIPVFG